MKYRTLQRAILEAERFVAVAKQVKPGYGQGDLVWTEHGRQSAAAKRASMDLTRALADMRGGK